MTGFEVLLEGLVAILLLATIVYAVVLNRKLNALRQGREEFETLVRDLNHAIERAEQGTSEFRKLSDSSAARLDGRVKEAQALRDDLGQLIDRGAALAEEVSTGMRRRRSAADLVEPLYPEPSQRHEEEIGDDEELPPETQEKLRKLLDTLR